MDANDLVKLMDGKKERADRQEIQRQQLVRSDVHLCNRMGMFNPLPPR